MLVCSCQGLVSGGFRFPPGVMTVAVRWYLRYALSYRDVEELLAALSAAVEDDDVVLASG
jgi:transposase-like protein